MAASLPFPVIRAALARTVRLAATAQPRAPVLLKLVSAEQLADLAEIESATSGRLLAMRSGSERLARSELAAGPAHAAFINAAFTYWRPRDLNRFSGPGRGAWYAALETRTCIAEAGFHMTRELANVDDFNATVAYTEMFASMAGNFVDLRRAPRGLDCLGTNTNVAYPAGNRLAEWVRELGHNGIIYPSRHDPAGFCIAALWPQVVQSVTLGDGIRLRWTGSPTPTVETIFDRKEP